MPITLPAPPLELQMPPKHRLQVRLVDDETGDVVRAAGHIGVRYGAGVGTVRWYADGSLQETAYPPGSYQLEVDVPGWVYRSVPFEMPADGQKAPLDVRLQRGGVLRGQVTDGDGRPLEGVLVVARGQTKGRYEERHATTDAGGRYELAGLDGPYFVGATSEGYADAVAPNVMVDPAASPATQDLRLLPGAKLFGWLVSRDNRPLPGYLVRVWDPDDPNAELPLLWSATADDGGFEVEHVPPGTWVVGAGKVQTTVTVKDGDELLVELPLAQ